MGALLEGVKDVDRLVEVCQVDDPILEFRPDANLADARTDRRQGLPVVWLESALKTPQLESCHLPCLGRKAAEILP